MKSYNQILAKIAEFAQAHIQVKKVDFDFLEQMGTKMSVDNKWPIIYVVPIQNTITQNQYQYIVDVYCLDYITQGRENINTIVSDCDLILKDLHRWFLDDPTNRDFEVNNIPNILPINNYLLDYVAGGRMRLEIWTDVHSVCDIPFNFEPQPPIEPCPEVTYLITLDGEIVEQGSIEAGGELNFDLTSEPVTYEVRYENGDIIESGTASAGDSIEVIVPNCPECENVEWELFNSDGTLLNSGSQPAGQPLTINAPDAIFSINGVQVATIPSGDSDSIQVRKAMGNDQIGSLQGQHWRIPNSTITLTNTVPTVLNTVSVPATENQTIVAPNANWVLKNTTNTTISSGSIPSNVSDDIIAPNANWVLKNTANTTISSGSIVSNGSDDIIAPDATYNVEYADGTPIESGSVVSNGSLSVIVPNCPPCEDATVQINGDEVATVASGGMVNIAVENESGTPLGELIDGVWVVPNCPPCPSIPVGANVMKTNQTTVYRTGDDGDDQRGRATDFFTLASNNPFGNTNRFTDLLGNQIYTDNVVIDWSTYDGTRALGYHVGIATSTNWNNQIDNAVSSTHLSYNDWRLANIKELCNIANLENGTAAGFSFNYAPFNMPNGIVIHSSTTNNGSTSQAMLRLANGNLGAAGKTTNGRRFDVRYFTNAELGI
jgi:hypothetical protein